MKIHLLFLCLIVTISCSYKKGDNLSTPTASGTQSDSSHTTLNYRINQTAILTSAGIAIVANASRESFESFWNIPFSQYLIAGESPYLPLDNRHEDFIHNTELQLVDLCIALLTLPKDGFYQDKLPMTGSYKLDLNSNLNNYCNFEPDSYIGKTLIVTPLNQNDFFDIKIEAIKSNELLKTFYINSDLSHLAIKTNETNTSQTMVLINWDSEISLQDLNWILEN